MVDLAESRECRSQNGGYLEFRIHTEHWNNEGLYGTSECKGICRAKTEFNITRSIRSSGMKYQRKGGALARLTLHRYGTAIGFDEIMAQHQAYAYTFFPGSAIGRISG